MSNTKTTKTHIPVMLEPALEMLNIKSNGFYIDCTLGEAGHSTAILSKLKKDGILLSLDRDMNAIEFVTANNPKELAIIQPKWKLFHSNYSKLSQILKKSEIMTTTNNRKADGILMDLGLSSRQLEIEPKGFSYIEEKQPLDMRMDGTLSVTAKDLMNGLLENELAKLFTVYGEEKFARPIAHAIKTDLENINTVGNLVKIVYKVIPSRVIKADKHHPARRIFQALRIAVNDEMNSLQEGLDGAYENLNKNGRLVVISFHSLEDRIVKNKFLEYEKLGAKILTKKHLDPDENEIRINPRAHSAKMRVLEK